MDGLAGVIAVAAMFGVPGIYLFGKTAIGEAIIERIRHGTTGGDDPALVAEVEDLRVRLAEMEERLDFAERALVAGSDERSTLRKSSGQASHEART